MSRFSGIRAPLTGDRRVDRALQDLAGGINRLAADLYRPSPTGPGTVPWWPSSSGPSGGGIGTTMKPRTGILVEIYKWNPTPPHDPQPGDKLGETTTDATGQWVFDVANDGGITRPAPVTILVGGVAKLRNPILVVGQWFQLPGGGWVPVYLGDIELVYG